MDKLARLTWEGAEVAYPGRPASGGSSRYDLRHEFE